ncbi:helix-turn-helix domain-containing protein [Halobacteria archaeon AArc-curdl1]|uniref:Helix-turn-helix domain-containing protein n=1 Tax=Natronosalvus hydrolyticus TaxID=2979988 RepID=A0AAP3E6L7_9EURY|nr:helix-turn-helix domain-containing protein [Halobacteria archaeon AArc-curdl1]
MSDEHSLEVNTNAERLVLIIRPENEATIARTLRTEMAAGEYTVVTAATVSEGREILERATVGCVVVSFDQVSATDFAALRARALCPILALVGAERTATALEMGATDVLRPDDPPAVVRRRVKNLLGATADTPTVTQQSAGGEPSQRETPADPHPAESLRRATTPSRVCTNVTEAIVDATPVSIAGCYLRSGDRLNPAAVVPAGADPPIRLPPIALSEHPELDPREISGPAIGQYSSLQSIVEEASDEAIFVAPIGDRGILFGSGSRVQEMDTAAIGTVQWLVALATLVLERLENQRRLEALETERKHLETDVGRWQSLGGALTSVVDGLEDGMSRSSFERVLCRELVSLEWIEGTWVGDLSFDSGTYSCREQAGITVVPLGNGDGTVPDSLFRELIDSLAAGDSALLSAVDLVGYEGTRSLPSGEREETTMGDTVFVPLVFDRRRYGVLGIRTDDADLGAETRERFDVVGSVLSMASAFLECRRFIGSDERLHLEIRITGGTSETLEGKTTADPLLALATSLECRLSVLALSVTPLGERHETTAALAVEKSGFEVPTVQSAVDSIDGIEFLEGARRSNGRLTLYVRLATETIAQRVTTHGGLITTIDGTGSHPTLHIEIAAESDVRSFVDLLDRHLEGVELRRKRTVSPGAQAGASFADHAHQRLTDRQLETLRLAYQAGYFEWPRERTGSEVAALLAVSQPTFARHLRIAQRKLYELLFDDGWLE